MAAPEQNKRDEVEFFDKHAASGTEYNVFTEATNTKLIDACVERAALTKGARVLDLGCGSGIFGHMLAQRGMAVTGVDISPKLIEIARTLYPGEDFQVGDAEQLAFPDGHFDAAFLGGVVHHFPSPQKMAREVARVVKPGGRFFAFDPNRRNPFMYLYRVKSSPFYSPVGVTPNEQPVARENVVRTFQEAGFDVETAFMSVKYTYVKSKKARLILPVFNISEAICFGLPFMSRFRAFLLTWGRKPAGASN